MSNISENNELIVEFSPEDNEMPTHTKRIGRELAMLYLFGREMNERVLSESREKFFDEAVGIMGWRETRVVRKGREYAENLLDLFVTYQNDIEARIKSFSENWKWERISLVDRGIMQIAVTEMLYAPGVPPVVSINEAVEIANDYSGENSGNFINGVLNAIKDKLDRPAREAVNKI